ncbi:alkylphosphonate utilization protein [Burkholderia sp. LA-2-3-30-S1-D2]|uniref:alkylphosphonate utilization protein n=1 Tax=Burkholderia sp. LA-2-3-30-S1-D2 TaxID=1637862 RepID=UPI000753D99D|nr:alkylphosphonate utilization protein [Burkholderia sp. LA-2-3-30-S1-D2]AOJ00329.1 alkylphosphonate utilization protein [Burkholderia sp. LA-2-3-30-S1-D2]KVE15563.1 alkylphosphonate utilization protein [Burkholderia sp. LA-2-3-30-S1-D2]
MNPAPACPQRAMQDTDPDGALPLCVDYDHEWAAGAESTDESVELAVKDMNAIVPSDGDSVGLIKDLRVKGSSITLETGTEDKGICLVDGDREVDCKTDMGGLLLNACCLKKM